MRIVLGGSCGLGTDYYDNDYSYGVRPVIEISESLVTTLVTTEYAIGTEVTIGDTGENFYVIKDEGSKLVLLAKYNLKAEGTNWIQDTSGGINECEFSAAGGFTANENLNNNSTLKADTTSAVYKAMKYAENTIGNGATGRLMTYGEALPLSESEDDEILEILYGTYTDGAYLNYWLGSADDESSVWYADCAWRQLWLGHRLLRQ